VISKNINEMKSVAGAHSLILNTISAKHDIFPYLRSLGSHGVLVFVGMIFGRRKKNGRGEEKSFIKIYFRCFSRGSSFTSI
jgi:D-arabinose 1-dehydrogenase-like Zn-dependent alcohol dehydrogenase